MPNMDYSLIQRTPDGTGKILVTTPGSPDKGSFVLEADMKIYTNQGMVAIADIVDDLVTADAAKPLSANQGVVLKQLIDAFSGGIVPKGDILSSNLPPADASNKGWQYYCTDINQWATSDGTQWIMTSNNVITQTPDATDTGHALSNAVVTQCCNEVKGKLNQHESRLENLEQKAGDYTTVQYRGTNAVPTGKAKNGLVETFVGKSRAWNQLLQNGNFANGDGWVLESGVTASFSDNVATISSTIENNGIRRSVDFITGHKYLVSADVSTESAITVRLGSNSSSGVQLSFTPSVFNQFINYCGVLTALNDYYTFFIFAASPYSNLKVRNVTLYDLTLIFGPGNEPSTVEDALAQLPALGQYNAYDAGSLVDTEVSAVKSVGVNIWDEVTEKGYYNNSGAPVANSNYLRSKNAVVVLPSTSYCFSIQDISSFSSHMASLFFYDASDNYISQISLYKENGKAQTVTSPSNARYLRFYMSDYYGTTYNHDIQICLNSYADKTTYHPYKTDTLSLPETVTLRSAGSVADTDELNVEVNGVARRRQTEKTYSVDLSTLNWTLFSDYGEYWVTEDLANIIKKGFDKNTPANILCEKYPRCLSVNEFIHSSHRSDTDACGSNGTNGVFFIRNGSNTVEPTGDAIIERDEYIVTLLEPIIENFIEVEGGGTVETIQTQTPVIDNCLDVGYLTL